MNESKLKQLDWLLLPLFGALFCVGLWHAVAGKKIYTLKTPATGIEEMRAGLVQGSPDGEAAWQKIKSAVTAGRFY